MCGIVLIITKVRGLAFILERAESQLCICTFAAL